jgi:hypothetical protein
MLTPIVRQDMCSIAFGIPTICVFSWKVCLNVKYPVFSLYDNVSFWPVETPVFDIEPSDYR